MSTDTQSFFEPGDRSTLPQAERDALQAADPDLSREAWAFLAVCAPDRAERLRQQQAAQAEKADRMIRGTGTDLDHLMDGDMVVSSRRYS